MSKHSKALIMAAVAAGTIAVPLAAAPMAAAKVTAPPTVAAPLGSAYGTSCTYKVSAPANNTVWNVAFAVRYNGGTWQTVAKVPTTGGVAQFDWTPSQTGTAEIRAFQPGGPPQQTAPLTVRTGLNLGSLCMAM